ncbi:MAG TPA: GspE/PulE family protein [Candidatus Paceibacterota bacterium]|nr:GspE/PulE family protein [Candidatus Paceibacterota bacterium]
MFGAKQQVALQSKLSEIHREAEERDAKRRAAKSGLPYIDLRTTPVSIDALKLVHEADARAANAAAIEISAHGGPASGGKNIVALAVIDPESPELARIVGKLKSSGFETKVFIASKSAVERVWESYSFVPKESKEITGKVELSPEEIEDLAKKLTSLQEVQDKIKTLDFTEVSTTSLFEVVLAGALSIGASDIHFEAEKEKAKVRFRLDGVLHDIFGNVPLKNYEHLVSRIKLLSNLKMNVRDQAQDGRFTIGLGGKEIEVRVSTIPSEFGETIVMRVLDPAATAVELKQLGLRKDDLEIVERQLKMPNGLILNTGPTGSGKTTTLYAFLRRIAKPEIKIITIEDPIEYRVEGVEQTQVDTGAGYTFADGLRSIMRQDPDIILVGEIRDHDTADIALQASLTGHLVFSTLHANDAVGAVPRLVDLGVKTVTIGPALSLVIAQRLVRKLCMDCKKETKLPAEIEAKAKSFLEKLPERVDKKYYEQIKIYEPVGCNKCNGFGYKGRIGIFEFMESKAEFEEAILKDASRITLKNLSRKQGMVTMQEDGILKSLEGVTSLEEVEDATGPLEW